MKTAVSIPNPIFRRAEQEARRRRWPRSRLYAEALSAFLRQREDEKITETLNRVYATEDSSIPEPLERVSFESSPESTW